MMSRITINLKKECHKKRDIDTELSTMPSPASAVVEHTRVQISSVLDISRSRIQEEHRFDLELDTRGGYPSSFGDIESGPSETESHSNISTIPK